MKYSLQFDKPHEQFVSISLELPLDPGKTILTLPAWRPGRYEGQNFARLISDESAQLKSGKPCTLKKISTHEWEIETEAEDKLEFSYRFFANLKDAGGTYLDEDRLLFNGITCLMYDKNRINEACELLIQLPSGWKMAGAFQGEGLHHCFSDYHQLIDTPFMAGREIFHHSFMVRHVPTHLWFLGECHPDLERMESEIRAYSEAQFDLFGSFPVDQYHYFYMAWPFAYRHGVEHFNSTVIVMGPGHKLMQSPYYDSLLEISSHELFHTWNVKLIRPIDMLPYDYSRPNYSRLHYITEGVTTYYGDLMLWKGGVWNLDRWIKSINGELQSHYATGAQDHISLEKASFQSWTNGYRVETVPNRKISFYTKGYLIAMLLDVLIRRRSKDKYSLDDLMRQMYQEFGMKNRGYEGEDFKKIAESLAGESMDDFWAKYIAGSADLLPQLKELGAYMGMTVVEMPPPDPLWNWWGMKLKKDNGRWLVEKLYESSPGRQAGLHIGDELVAIAGKKVDEDINHWLMYLKEQVRVDLHFFHHQKLKSVQLPLDTQPVFRIPQFVLRGKLNKDERQHLENWQRINTPESIS